MKFILLASLFVSSCAIGCEIRIERSDESSAAGAVHYEVFANRPSVKRFTVTLRRVDEEKEPCEQVVVIRPKSTARLHKQSEFLSYRLAPLSERSRQEGEQIFAELDHLQPDEQFRFSYQMKLLSQQFVSAGRYEGELQLILTEDRLSNQPPIEERRLQLAAEVAPAVRMSFAGTQGRSRTADFGELKSGVTVTPSPLIVVQSTEPFSLAFHSEHHGVLRHANHNKKWDIPYEARLSKVPQLGEVPLDLALGPVRVRIASATSKTGLRLPLLLTVPVVTRRPAGVYTDTLRLEIMPWAVGGL